MDQFLQVPFAEVVEYMSIPFQLDYRVIEQGILYLCLELRFVKLFVMYVVVLANNVAGKFSSMSKLRRSIHELAHSILRSISRPLCYKMGKYIAQLLPEIMSCLSKVGPLV